MRSHPVAVLALTLLASAWPLSLGAQTAPAPSAEPAPATAAPSQPAAPPTAAPLPSPSPSPAPTATPANASPYHYVVAPPAPAPGKPAIIEIDMLESTIHAGGPYSVRVKTSLDVTAINVSAMGGTYGMQGAGPGLFATDGKVPGEIPFFLLNRSYTVTVTALTADGRSTSIPVTLRLER